MKSSGAVTVCAIIVALCLWAGTAVSQGEKKVAVDKPVTVADILKQAKCPLTNEQVKKLKDLDLSQGREAFQSLYGIFDEKQTEALKKALGTRPGRDNGPETPRYLMQLVLFEKAGCPLTGKQLEALKALPQESGSYQKMQEIFTDKQKEEMQKIFGNR